jgi:transcription-repair coupling factor (superfamily II helicase)
MTLQPLLEIAHADPDFRRLADAARAGGAVGRVSSTFRPFLTAALVADTDALGGRPVLIVVPDDVAARDLTRELNAYLGGRRVRHYPSRGTGYASQIAPPPHLVGLRIAALDALAGGEEAPVVVASAVALAETVPAAELRPAGFTVRKGEEMDLELTAEQLVDAGYERTDQVEARGQFAIRGGILDVYPATEDRAARLELFGDELESIRWFSTFTQRSLGEGEMVELAPAAELASEYRMLAEVALDDEERPDIAELIPVDKLRAPLDLLPPNAAIVISGAEDIEPALRDHWEDVTAAMHDADARQLYVDVAKPLEDRASLSLRNTDTEVDGGEDAVLTLRAQTPTSPARSIGEAETKLQSELRSGYRVIVAFDHRGEAERARFNLNRIEAKLMPAGLSAEAEPQVLFAEAVVAEGFVSPAMKLAVYPWRKLVHRRRDASMSVRGSLASMADLSVGDHVVHEDHGIARFAGFETKTVAGVTRDYLELEYKGSDRVFAPTEQLAKITRYVGVGGEAPQLSSLGSKRWDAIKTRARRAAREMAGELLNLYAERATRRGHQFGPDGEYVMELERAFPYRETADQIEAIEATKGDMESERPMDRLICGDVGYGKTEVALRAACKAVGDGKQVMILVPTTVLAQQHLGTFRERFAELPFEVEMVSRLRKPAEVKAIVKRFSEGSIDVLIGTHRLLSRDIRAKDLGLLVVDEEQRFGVKQKELLRQMKLKVDVLALSATPIPRTLQMSLAGLRDISVIETPPEGRRPVRTYVGPFDEELVSRAIEREHEREGQTFFLHNRIDTLHETAERLRALCPEVSFMEAHGQMDADELERTMLGFMRGEAECLVTTTIIESGIDIPQANTLIVERADMLGLAQAYQIRGRVGRSKERAFAYMLYPSQEALSADAEERLATLSDHTELGSGFAIAMRDLEQRGAGDLLGDEQSGHVAAIGYELYLAMLEEATEALQNGDSEGAPESQVRVDVAVDAYVPSDYIPFETAKIELHRKIAGARETGELRGLALELRDRFGPVPEPVEALLELQRVRIELGQAGARVAEVRGGRLSISPLDLRSETVAAIREKTPEAMYQTAAGTLSVRVGSEPAERLATLAGLSEAIAAAPLPETAGEPVTP